MANTISYETVIGLEVHCQLSTATKIFSAAPTDFGAEPNTQVAPVDMGLPGALPALNYRAVACAIRAGLALECRINEVSQFARKNYFYPDLPKGYQISQHTLPVCSDGQLAATTEDGEPVRVRIERIHMEEDAGKSTHLTNQPWSAVDLNRAGVPLIEIVSHPDMRSSAQAVAYLKALHEIVVALGVCDGNMEEGSFRVDANVSVRPEGQVELGTRCELKNINSFRFVQQAIDYEVGRQIALIEGGGTVTQQTRLYDPDRQTTFAMRDKEEAHDYRYFPEPDLPPLVIDRAWLAQIEDALPELPAARRARYMQAYGLSDYDAAVLVSDADVADYFEQTIAHHPDDPKAIANWIANDVLAVLDRATTIHTVRVRPEGLAEILALQADNTISSKIARQIFAAMLESGESAATIVEREGLRQISDEGALGALIDEVMEANPAQVQQFRDGKTKLRGFFVGQIMKKTGGKADPAALNRVLTGKLNGDA